MDDGRGQTSTGDPTGLQTGAGWNAGGNWKTCCPETKNNPPEPWSSTSARPDPFLTLFTWDMGLSSEAPQPPPASPCQVSGAPGAPSVTAQSNRSHRFWGK